MIDLEAIRLALAGLPSDHDAAGAYRPRVDEIFTPAQHAAALDPNTVVVVGARGAGKSFWAGVLTHEDTRAETAGAYPRLALDRLIVQPGYNGFDDDLAFGRSVIDARVPSGEELSLGPTFWQAVIIRAGKAALNPDGASVSIGETMARYADPEEAAAELRQLDQTLVNRDRMLLVVFDALDTLSREWSRSNRLVDALFEAVWSLRVRRALRAKIFIRPEQLDDESLQFVELPKLRSGRVELEWKQSDLYGLLFWRLLHADQPSAPANFEHLVATALGYVPQLRLARDRRSPLFVEPALQKPVMERMAGAYMGSGAKKGNTYDWPFRHTADAAGRATPRSFVKLFVEAAQHGPVLPGRVISPDGIKAGLRAASRVRVDQLGLEYKWVKRALAPLAGVRVPCAKEVIFDLWRRSRTVTQIMQAANDPSHGFLPPFPPVAKGDQQELLLAAMQRIGLLQIRDDNRVDIPDLFRVAALMLKKGAISPAAN